MAVSGAECGGGYLRQPATGALELVVHAGLSPEFAQDAGAFPAGSPIHQPFGGGASFVSGMPIDPERRARCEAEGFRVVAVFAVGSADGVLGTIHLASRQRDRFEPDALRAVAAISTLTAAAMARLEAEAASRRRARYADAIAAGAACLLAAADRGPALQQVLDALLAAAGVNRVYVFENVDDDALGLCMEPVAEAIAAGMEPQIGNPAFRRIPYAVGAPSLLAPLEAGQLFSALVRTLEPPERDLLEPLGVRSIVVVPIHVRRKLWGFIGLVDCFADRIWPEDDVRALRTVASMIGSFLTRKEAEDAVRESEARYRAIVEGFDGLIYVCSQDYRVEFANAAMHARAGRDVIGEACHRALHGTSERCAWCANERVLRGENVRFEVQSPLDSRWYYCVNTPIHHANGTISKQAMILDITEQKLAEQTRREFEARLAETQRLESLGVLAGGIAHDFNNLLVAILGNTELAALQLGATSSARLQLDNIRVAAQRAAELTSQMLACAGKGRFVVQRLSLNDLVTEVVGLLNLSIPRDAALVCELAPGLPLVEADSSQLGQVVMNLLKNACDALDSGAGTISMRTGVVQPIADSGAQRVYLEVSDTGVGMDDETMARVFDPFFTTKFTGRGLGLAAVQGIIRAHAGTIDVASELGKGTTFRVVLPVSGPVRG